MNLLVILSGIGARKGLHFRVRDHCAGCKVDVVQIVAAIIIAPYPSCKEEGEWVTRPTHITTSLTTRRDDAAARPRARRAPCDKLPGGF